MYGSLLSGRVTPGIGLLGAAQRDEPDKLHEILIQRHKSYGYDDLTKAMLYASERGQDDCVKVLLRHNVPPDVHDANGFTPLHVAAKRGHANVMMLLIEGRCNVNKANYRVRATALHWAATNGHEECVDLLLGAGVNVDAQTSNGRTPMMLAARCGHLDIVQNLLETEAQVNKCDFDRASALHLAAEEGQLDTVCLLLKAGAKINAKMKSGDTPLLLALKRGHISVVQHLLTHPDIEPTPTSHGLSALHWLAQSGHTECLSAILPYYTNPNIQTDGTYYGPHFVVNSRVSPLMLSCGWGHTETTRLLLTHGANTSLSDVEGMIPMFYAIKRDHGDSVVALLDHGADPDQCQPEVDEDDPELLEARSDSPTPTQSVDNQFTLTPLFMCIERNSIQSFFALLVGGCDLNMIYLGTHGQLMGPLEYSLYKARIDMCFMLLNLGHVFNLPITPLVQHALAFLLQSDESSFTQFMNLLSTPPPLIQQCRWQIRQSLRMSSAIETLPVPESMKKYIQLSDIKEFIRIADEEK